jgi:hypothetical protein
MRIQILFYLLLYMRYANMTSSRFIDNKLNFQFIQLISIKHSGIEKDGINWAWLFAEKLPTKQKYQFNNL